MSILKNCRICGEQNFTDVVDFGNQPWCNNFLRKAEVGFENYYPLKLIYCNSCKVSQLNYTVPKEVMFGDHTYLSGITKSLSLHFKNLRDEIINKFSIKNKKKILDLGSNDGTFLKHFKNLGWKVLGVEPATRVCKIATDQGIKTINKFFNYETSKEINEKFDFINASGVFFHLEELHSFTKGVKNLLANDGVFIVQFLYMKSIMKNVAFDQIYHEHLLYYNLNTLEFLLSLYDLEIFDAKLHEIHGGQMTAYISKKNTRQKSENLIKLKEVEINEKSNELSTYQKFKENIEVVKKNNIEFIDKALKDKKIIFGLGAPVKGNTLLNYFGFNSAHIPKLLEINLLRKGLYAPGSHIPVEIEDEVSEIPDIYYVLAWNFKKEILEKKIDLVKKGVEFYFPIKL